MRRFARFPALRALVIALTVALGSAGTLPLWATLLGVEGPHACHCSRDHHDCVCARCHTDPDAAMRISSETLKARCGDDEVVYGGHRAIAITPAFAGVPVASSFARTKVRAHVDWLRSRDRAEPLIPPPRA